MIGTFANETDDPHHMVLKTNFLKISIIKYDIDNEKETGLQSTIMHYIDVQIIYFNKTKNFIQVTM